VPLFLNILFAAASLVLSAAGLVVIFGLMRVVNFAQGEFMMLGAYAAFWVVGFASFWPGVLLAMLLVGVGGALVEVVLVRRLYLRPLDTILATWGLALVIREAMRLTVGQGYRSVPPPVEGPVNVLGTAFSAYRLILIGCAVGLLIVMWFVERRTSFGRLVRGVIENPELARGLGVNVDRVYMLSFAAGSALAGLAGALLAPLVTVSPSMGSDFLIGAFLTAIVAGPSLLGIGGAAGVLGGTQGLVSEFVDQTGGAVALLVAAVVVMRVRDSRLWRKP
jgi:branched-subunit amino acid ABC-type transport system permease component